jgi:hypothetical protein
VEAHHAPGQPRGTPTSGDPATTVEGAGRKPAASRGANARSLQPDDIEGPTTRLVWERIYGRPLTDNDLTEIEGNLFRFIDLLASMNGSILGTPESSTFDGDEAA